MRANRIHHFGPPDVISFEEVPRPAPGRHEVLVRVRAAGVGPWDAWVRGGQSAVPQPLPLTLGSDLSGLVEQVGEGVAGFEAGEEVFGVTNPRFVGANAEYAVVAAGGIARKPPGLGHVKAASVPVVAVTAWQMLHDHANVARGQSVLIHGAAGNVGAYAVQLARRAGASVLATAFAEDTDYLRGLGADEIIDVRSVRFEDAIDAVDIVIDLLGGEMQARSLPVLKRGGVLVSSVSKPDAEEAGRRGVRAVFILVDVTQVALARLAALIESGDLHTHVGLVLPLGEARTAHEIMRDRRPRVRGKIVLDAEI